MIYRRLLSLCVVLTVLLILVVQEALATTIDCQESAFLTLINDYRKSRGLSSLTLSPTLVVSAQKHSYDMSTHNYFDHANLIGLNPWDRTSLCGYPSQNVGECIYAGRSSAEDAFNSWKDSPSHNVVMLDPGYTAIGMGRAYNPYSIYGWYWTADFGDFSDYLSPMQQICQYRSASICGRLVNTKLQAIPGSIIFVDDIRVTSDVFDGHFEAGQMPAGTHAVSYSAPGYLPQTQILEFIDGQMTLAPVCLLSPVTGSNSAFNQPSPVVGEIYGRVLDRFGRPVKNAAVRINQTLMPTNANGEYRFTMVTQGTYEVYIDYYGCRGEILRNIKVDSGLTSNCPIVTMKPL